jgi:hypothetical protein
MNLFFFSICYIFNFLFLPLIDCHLIAAGHFNKYSESEKPCKSSYDYDSMAMALLRESADLYFCFCYFFLAFSFI